MPNITIAVDLAKNVFEVAVANTAEGGLRRHRFSRSQFDRFLRSQTPAHVVMEACGTADHWGRVAQAAGHRVTLLPAQYVRPFVRRQKTDRTDAAGLLDAVRSEGLKPVVVKTVAQQELLALHRIRNQWMTTRTARINALRGLLREHGVAVPSGARRGLLAVGQILADLEAPVPGRLRRALELLVSEVREVEARIAVIERELRAIADQDAAITRLMEIPGVGLLTATALAASVAHIHGFHRGRQFASWLGLTPREHSSGDRRRLGGITKQGNVYLRCLLTHGARAVLLAAHRATLAQRPLNRLQQWALDVATRRGHNRATIALANKMARIIWAVWSRDVAFLPRPAAA